MNSLSKGAKLSEELVIEFDQEDIESHKKDGRFSL
jgi:hypothetical protein